MLVPTSRTVVSPAEIVPAFAQSFFDFNGFAPEAIDCAIIVGKLVMECGWWNALDRKQSCWCWNVGNIRGRAPSGDFCLLRGAHEFARPDRVPKGATIIPTPAGHVTPAGMVAYLPPPETQEFRAYASIEEACDDYVEVLSRRFQRSWRQFVGEGTDPALFVDAMKADGYFTGDVTNYRNVAVAVAMRVLADVARLLADALPPYVFPPHALSAAPPEWMPQTSAHTVLPDIVPLVSYDEASLVEV